MRKTIARILLPVSTIILIVSCSQEPELGFHHQVTGPIGTNCYLIYDAKSKEAALIDVGGPIDSLVTRIEENDLHLKYIFATHNHMDHVEGVPQIQDRFPDALLCYNRHDYEDFLIFREWMKEDRPDLYADLIHHPELAKWMECDLTIFKEPDIYLEDNQTYKLGELEIRTMLAPGHTRGSICFAVGERLFSGDVLFHRSVGRTDLLGGSKDDIITSVRRLYAELPDKTIVHPGHGEFTDIGSEMLHNREVSADSEAVEN